jgi:hypothetical protein
VNLDTAGFHCFGCDAKGGDLISFLLDRGAPHTRLASKSGSVGGM